MYNAIVLQERINDQQKYVEILKTEKEQLKELSSARSHSSLGSLGSLGSLSSNIRRVSVNNTHLFVRDCHQSSDSSQMRTLFLRMLGF